MTCITLSFLFIFKKSSLKFTFGQEVNETYLDQAQTKAIAISFPRLKISIFHSNFP